MTLKKCKHCNTPIVLYPTAKARAARYGGSPDDYANLFTEHSSCLIVLHHNDAWSVEALRTLIRHHHYYGSEFTAQGKKKLGL